MAECFLVQNGGGNPLNFKVVGNPQPASAKENTIWVDTDKINNYYFSATQPENMMEYDVWFYIGTTSSVAFSATKKNPIMVYPFFAKQYIGGALVDKTAKSYQNGQWVEWISYIVKDGITATPFTIDKSVIAYTQKNGYMLLKTQSGSLGEGRVIWSNNNNAIDLSAHTAIYVDVEATSSRSDKIDFFTLGVSNPRPSSDKYDDTSVSQVKFELGGGQNVARKTVKIEIPDSLSEGYLVAILSDDKTISLKIYSAWLT